MAKTKLALTIITLVLLFSLPTSSAVSQTPPTCGPSATVQEILDQVTNASVTKWIRDFSGENDVQIGGSQTKILTRFSTQMFNLDTNARAYPYLGEQLLNFGYLAGTYLTDHAYTPYYYPTGDEAAVDLLQVSADYISSTRISKVNEYPEQANMWKNKVVTIPGHGPNADEIVLITAHMDSTSNQHTTLAPGAEDNASGISALMEAARLFRFYKFDRTIKIIFFTGEEQGLWGSAKYVSDHYAEMDDIVGVVNLDMFGYDNDHDMCIELHVGEMTSSNQIGNCFTNVNTNYTLGLTYDYLTDRAIEASDHASFWDAGVGAIEVLENYQYDPVSYGCGGRTDRNPHYHRTTDTIDKMYLPVTLATVKAGIGTTASLAGPIGKCFASDPELAAIPQADSIRLTWPEIVDADVYDIYRSTTSCDGTFTKIAQATTNSFEDTDIEFGQEYSYKVQAAESGAVCFSQMSNCAVAVVEEPVFYQIYIPLIIAGE